MALTSVGLAILAADSLIGAAAENPGKVRVASHPNSAFDDAESADLSIDQSSGVDDVLDADEDEEGGVSIRIVGEELNDREDEPTTKRTRVYDDNRVALPQPAILRPTNVQQPAPVAQRAARPWRVNPTAKQYPFERAASFAPPVGPTRSVAATQDKAVRPVEFQTVQHQAGQQSASLAEEDSDDEDDELNDDSNSAPAAFEEETEMADDANPPLVPDDCTAVTEPELKSFADEMGAITKRKPISALRADLKIRLPKEQSGLIDDEGRAAARENARCTIEHDRALVRHYFRAKYGPGFDRGSTTWYDVNLAPEFPFCYHPLYFEDPNLERCGYSLGCCTQSFVSGLQFYGNVAALPFKMLMIHPCDYVYPQDDCEPCTRYSYWDNFLGPYPETTGWGLFRSRGSCRNRRCR